MAKLTTADVSNIGGNPTSAATTINNNFAAVETAMENTLSRDGTSPNTMSADLDMNSNRILNLPAPVNGSEPLRLQDASTLNGGGTIEAYPQASYVVIGASSDLTNERIITAGSNITITDGGAGSTVTISSAGGVTDGDKGDITVSGSGATFTIDNDVVTYAKMQNVSATDMVLGRSTAGAGDVEEIACTAAGRALLDDANAAAQRTTLGVTSIATVTAGAGIETWLATPSSANLATAITDETGTGALVFANTPTLVTPVLGTPTSGTLTNCTGLPIATGVSGLAAGVATFLATPSSANLISAVTDETGTGALVFANTPTLVTPVLGTPTSGTLTNCTGLPISTGVSGLGANVATFLATPSSANLASAVTDETGSGALVFGTSPTISAPTLSGTTNLTGGQIAFPASQSASADANTLDDYEEGTWTPVLTFATAGNLSVTYSAQVGQYTKIGHLVMAWVSLATSAFTHTTASGNCLVTGLPFTSENSINWRSGAGSWQGITKANYTDICPVAQVNTTQARLDASGSGQSLVQVTATDMPTGGTVILGGCCMYQV